MTNPYDILGVDNSSSDADIKTAYRRMAKKHHPDAGGDEKHFAEISNAYDQIKNADSRFNWEQSNLQFHLL